MPSAWNRALSLSIGWSPDQMSSAWNRALAQHWMESRPDVLSLEQGTLSIGLSPAKVFCSPLKRAVGGLVIKPGTERNKT